MYYSTFYSILCIYLIGVNFLNAGDSKVCANAADCTDPNTKCLKDVNKLFDNTKGNYCGTLCDPAQVDTQCGKGETCDKIKDIDNVDVQSCVKNVECISDAFCKQINPLKPTCNLFTLKCTGPDITTTSSTTSTTTTSRIIVTTTEIQDLLVGPYGCQAHIRYCNDPIWMDLMRSKCPKTCGFVPPSTGGAGGTAGCKDAYSDCPKRSSLCKHTIYRDFMRRNCPYTCGYC